MREKIMNYDLPIMNFKRLAGRPSKTGVPGVSISHKQRGGGKLRKYYQARLRKNGKPFIAEYCVNTLGESEAFRRALRVRANYETSLGLTGGNQMRKGASI
jgi:hypothetical protein